MFSTGIKIKKRLVQENVGRIFQCNSILTPLEGSDGPAFSYCSMWTLQLSKTEAGRREGATLYASAKSYLQSKLGNTRFKKKKVAWERWVSRESRTLFLYLIAFRSRGYGCHRIKLNVSLATQIDMACTLVLRMRTLLIAL